MNTLRNKQNIIKTIMHAVNNKQQEKRDLAMNHKYPQCMSNVLAGYECSVMKMSNTEVMNLYEEWSCNQPQKNSNTTQ